MASSDGTGAVQLKVETLRKAFLAVGKEQVSSTPQRILLTDLPTELLHLIAFYLAQDSDWEALGALRGCCEILYDAATPVFWHDYSIASHEDASLRQDQLLRLNKHRTSLTRHVRALDIDLSEWEDEDSTSDSARLPGVIFALLTEPVFGPFRHLTSLRLSVNDCLTTVVMVPREISDALYNLKNLKHLILDPCYFEARFSLLEALPSLVDLTLECYERSSFILDKKPIPSLSLRHPLLASQDWPSSTLTTASSSRISLEPASRRFDGS
ncbi:hypothetical protein BCR35DRAFT_183261 [Leucosporidium creatinivorum]|uniref:F-box domain-containing protein n=1 Tax=Leucosporidium creatinivorum TaxID=106004 RepID=A0A1Y2E547_9BASI|nr:hypothetical protein BCR35DRAFT_183261 [Leucosporidium creatinivorum]